MISPAAAFAFFFACFSAMESSRFLLCAESCSTSLSLEATGCFFIIDLMPSIRFKSLEKFSLSIFRSRVASKTGTPSGNRLMTSPTLLMH